MVSIYFGALVGCICTYAVAVGGHPQFYYMVPAPPAPPASTFYPTPFGPNPYSFGAPAASFVSRSFGPSQAYYSSHQTFGSLAGAAPHAGYQTFAQPAPNGIVQTQTSEQPTGSGFAQAPTTTVFSTGPSEQYRGFAYHTQSTNGASANVFFLTGPEAHQIANLQTFTSRTTAQNRTGSQSVQKAKKLASDAVDSNATDKNQHEQIVETLTGPPQGPAFDAIRSFFQNPQIGFQQFYASNGQLFSKAVEQQNLNLPANTVLLPAPISIQAFGNFGLNPRFGQIENVTEANATKEKTDDKAEGNKTDDKGEEGAESIIADVRVKPSDNPATIAGSTSTTTETASSSAAAKPESTKQDGPTLKEARSIKLEAHTTKEDRKTRKEEPSTTAKAESSSEKSTGVAQSSIEDGTTNISSTTKAA